MRDLFPEDPQLRLFAQRFSEKEFDPTAIRPIISPTSQARPKGLPLPALDKPISAQNSPMPAMATIPQITLSPKRPLDESDNESAQPRKLARSDSPLKGAAGRRLDAQKKSQLRQELSQNGSHSVTPIIAPPPMYGQTSLPPAIHHLLSVLPRAESYLATVPTVFIPQRMIDLVRSVDLSRVQRQATTQPAAPPVQIPGQFPYAPPNSTYLPKLCSFISANTDSQQTLGTEDNQSP